MTDFIEVQLESGGRDDDSQGESSVVLFEAAESDLVALHGGHADVQEWADAASVRLEAIADAAEHIYETIRDRLSPDKVELQMSVGLSGEVGWFVAKSAASGSLALTLTWTSEPQSS